MRLMVFTIRSTEAWWHGLGDALSHVAAVTYVSDLPGEDVDLNVDFHARFRSGSTGDWALQHLGSTVCEDIILRCRLLRTLDRSVALRMIGAMWQTWEALVDTHRPDALLTFVVDRYLLDIAERVLRRRNLPYLGLFMSPVPGQIMFMAKGEYVPVREPAAVDVEQAIAEMTRPGFTAYLPPHLRFDRRRFLSLYARFEARWLLFELLRHLRRVPYDYRYRVTRDHSAAFRIRLSDWRVMDFLQRDWQQRLERTPFDRRVFVGLHVNPEAVIEYWVRDTAKIDYPTLYERAAETLGREGYVLFVKDHPSQFGFRQVELYERLRRLSNVVFVPYEVAGTHLIDQCGVTLTMTGTIGLQAALTGRCAIVEADAYYREPSHFVPLGPLRDIDSLPRRVGAFSPPARLDEARFAIMHHLLRASVPGTHTWQSYRPGDAASLAALQPLVDSLHRYLPELVRRGALPDRGLEAAPGEGRDESGNGRQPRHSGSSGRALAANP